MEIRKSQVEELQELQEALELQGRQILAAILELDADAGPEALEPLRLKLMIINREMSQAKGRLSKLGGYCMSKQFASPEKTQAMLQGLQQSVPPRIAAAMGAKEEAEAKLQICRARVESFETQKAQVEKDIGELKEEISRVLQAGGDPGKINQKLRGKAQDMEDLAGWIAQLQQGAILEVKTKITEAEATLQREMVKAINQAKVLWENEMNDLLAAATELLDSWPEAVHQFFQGYQMQNPANGVSELALDHKRGLFYANLVVNGALGGVFSRAF